MSSVFDHSFNISHLHHALQTGRFLEGCLGVVGILSDRSMQAQKGGHEVQRAVMNVSDSY